MPWVAGAAVGLRLLKPKRARAGKEDSPGSPTPLSLVLASWSASGTLSPVGLLGSVRQLCPGIQTSIFSAISEASSKLNRPRLPASLRTDALPFLVTLSSPIASMQLTAAGLRPTSAITSVALCATREDDAQTPAAPPLDRKSPKAHPREDSNALASSGL